jgi:hypothetical protein
MISKVRNIAAENQFEHMNLKKHRRRKLSAITARGMESFAINLAKSSLPTKIARAIDGGP